MSVLPPVPTGDRVAVEGWVAEHLGSLTLEGPRGVVGSPAFVGGQRAADAAIAALDVTGYARRRSEVWPAERRGASRLSPYVRHGLVDLPRAWAAVAGAPERDRRRFRDELLWQEYARHVYARVGTRTREPLRHEPARGDGQAWDEPWPARMACMALTVGELEGDGWLVNQTRLWLASQWTVRAGADWRAGEDAFFRHLLDGSRAANRLGWQWAVGAGTGRPYGFSRWQVEKRAPGLCAGCPVERACPVQEFPDAPAGAKVDAPEILGGDPHPEATGGPLAATGAGVADTGAATAGGGSSAGGRAASDGPRTFDELLGADGPAPRGEQPTSSGGSAASSGEATSSGGPAASSGEATSPGGPAPEAVWLTAESLGDRDPALAARPELPAVFVFDRARLERWRLSGKRLVFLAETLGELAQRRPVELHLGDPGAILAGRPLAATWTPVPGWRRLRGRLEVVEEHPWRWLARPHGRSARSFSSWRKAVDRAGGVLLDDGAAGPAATDRRPRHG